MIAVGGARLPERRLRFQRGDHRLPGLDLGRAQRGVDGREPGLVGEQEEDGDLLLPELGELGPVAGHRGLHVELAPLLQQVRARRSGAFGRGEDQLQGVLVIGSITGAVSGVAVEGAAVEVDDLAPAHMQAECRSRLLSGLEVLAEGIFDRGEAGLDVSSDAHVHDVVLSSRRCAGRAGGDASIPGQGQARPAAGALSWPGRRLAGAPW